MKDQLLALRDRYAPPLLELMEETIESIPEDGSPLVEMGRHHLQTGGKRLRAMLPLAVGRRLGADPDALLPFGAACELLHNATLVHDDLQDGDRTRRGESTVWSTFGSERAINLGDAMLYWPLLLIDRLDCSAATRNTLYRTTTRQTLSVIDGQDREYEINEERNLDRTAYRRMVEGKTGGLFVLPARGAAQFAGAPPGLERAVATAAEHLGVLFQIQDDILDLYGDKGRDQRGNDLREGKISALVVRFAERAPQEEVDRLIDLLEAPRESVSASDVDWAAERFRESGALNAAAGDLDTEHRRAVESSGIGTHPELAALVDGLAELFTAPIGDVLEQTDSELH